MELFEKVYGAATATANGTSSSRNSSSSTSEEKKNLSQVLREIMVDGQQFDPTNFVHMHEVPGCNLRANVLGPFPLVQKAGVCVISKVRIYFQPFHGVRCTIAHKALSWSLDDVIATARRYHGLKDEALEIFFREGSSVLMAFEGYANREHVFRLLPTERRLGAGSVGGAVGGAGAGAGGGEDKDAMVPVLCHTDRSFVAMVVDAWRKGSIDNFEYILALNSAAGRSMYDLSRYPIFPWVLADYTSDQLDLTGMTTVPVFRDLTKPIGALNQERLEGFKARWKNMQDMGGAFLYGTHYSAPGYCLYYLVRAVPEQMLCLQNGKKPKLADPVLSSFLFLNTHPSNHALQENMMRPIDYSIQSTSAIHLC